MLVVKEEGHLTGEPLLAVLKLNLDHSIAGAGLTNAHPCSPDNRAASP